MLAGILGSALIGIEEKMIPPPPITGNAYALDLPLIPDTWEEAITVFEKSEKMARIFSKELITNLVMTKRQELHYMGELTPQEQTEIYLDTV
jgi:glutamine synthetase